MPSAPLGATGLKMPHHEITFMPAVQILYSYEHVAFRHTERNRGMIQRYISRYFITLGGISTPISSLFGH